MKQFALLCLLGLLLGPAKGRLVTLESPSGHLRSQWQTEGRLRYRLWADQQLLLDWSPIGMTFDQGRIIGANSRLWRVKEASIRRRIEPVYGPSAEIVDEYEEAVFVFREDFEMVVRMYDRGMAWRFRTEFHDSAKVLSETATFGLKATDSLFFGEVSRLQHSFEAPYERQAFGQVPQGTLTFAPVYAQSGKHHLLMAESAVENYPGMHLSKTRNHPELLSGIFAQYPAAYGQGGYKDFDKTVEKRNNYLAHRPGETAYPWRAVLVEQSPKNLLSNRLIYQLAPPNRLESSDWIAPGQVAWDWWHNFTLTGVDFESGINMATYRYHIDFAAEYGIEYVNLDEGWSQPDNLLKQRNNIDVAALANYAEEKGVKLILWCLYRTLEAQMDTALQQFEQWGVAGLKVDFFDCNDAAIMGFIPKLAEKAAQHHLVLNLHGVPPPVGLSRTYPNLLNYEAVMGAEYYKFSPLQGPQNELDLPFIRNPVGPMDYTPGALRNYPREQWYKSYSLPASIGTRMHQLAMYVAYYQPLAMLADAPTAYEKAPDFTRFLGQIPTTWDETLPMQGQPGQHLVLARRKGSDWYLAGLNAGKKRRWKQRFLFLEDGVYKAQIWTDGPNAHKMGSDYRYREMTLGRGEVLDMQMARDGGFVMRLRKVE